MASEGEPYRPVVLPSLLVDVKPNGDDIEPDTFLPYFLRLKERYDRKKAETQARAQEKQVRMKETLEEELRTSGRNVR
jgi:hypothetical protein